MQLLFLMVKNLKFRANFDEKLESGFGIMVDDVLAAIYAVIVVFAIHYWML